MTISIQAGRPSVSRAGLLSMQVCVPREWTDDQVTRFANKENPTGIDCGWVIRKEGDPLLDGSPERVQCAECASNVHIMLDC